MSKPEHRGTPEKHSSQNLGAPPVARPTTPKKAPARKSMSGATKNQAVPSPQAAPKKTVQPQKSKSGLANKTTSSKQPAETAAQATGATRAAVARSRAPIQTAATKASVVQTQSQAAVTEGVAAVNFATVGPSPSKIAPRVSGADAAPAAASVKAHDAHANQATPIKQAAVSDAVAQAQNAAFKTQIKEDVTQVTGQVSTAGIGSKSQHSATPSVEPAVRTFREDPALDRRIIEGMLQDRETFLERMQNEGFNRDAILRRAAELGLSEALVRQVKGVAADLAGERPGRRPAPASLGARTCLSCDRIFLSSGPGNRLCMRCRGGDAGLARL